MKYVRDLTGRFPSRPHYEPSELDAECDRVLTEFFMETAGKVTYPVSTDNLTLLIERYVESLDLYADLSAEGPGVEGVTTFRRGKKPIVRIAQELASDARREVRLRTTLSHEFGHVHFHNALFQMDNIALDLFDSSRDTTRVTAQRATPGAEVAKCKRDHMVTAPQADWMEWQAGYVCGAVLMPRRAMSKFVQKFCDRRHVTGTVSLTTPHGRDLVGAVAEHFFASTDAARVRLEVLKLVSKAHDGSGLFA